MSSGPPTPGIPRPRRPTAVLLDAFGTLLHLPDPVPALARALGDEGHPHEPDRVRAAFAAEVRHYRANLHRGSDASGVATLRAECAAALGAELGGDHPPLGRLTEILVDALRFALFPDATPALEDLAEAGHRLAVVSDWDASLPAVLTRLGVADRFDAVVASAAVGARKPQPQVFRVALARLRVDAAQAVHCGDESERDVAGARAAGIRGVLIDRSSPADRAGGRIRSLRELPALAPGQPLRRA